MSLKRIPNWQNPFIEMNKFVGHTICIHFDRWLGGVLWKVFLHVIKSRKVHDFSDDGFIIIILST